MTFDLVSPKLQERMGLVKYTVEVEDYRTVDELAAKMDLKTSRITAPVQGTELMPGDRMIQFGPFDLPPGCFEAELWGRLKDKVRKFKPGDQPIPITFRRGAYEGTRSWPEPAMAAEATVPRSPLFFEAFRESRTSKFIAALEQALQQVKLPKPRVLEIGAGPVAVYSMCAARR